MLCQCSTAIMVWVLTGYNRELVTLPNSPSKPSLVVKSISILFCYLGPMQPLYTTTRIEQSLAHQELAIQCTVVYNLSEPVWILFIAQRIALYIITQAMAAQGLCLVKQCTSTSCAAFMFHLCWPVILPLTCLHFTYLIIISTDTHSAH